MIEEKNHIIESVLDCEPESSRPSCLVISDESSDVYQFFSVSAHRI